MRRTATVALGALLLLLAACGAESNHAGGSRTAVAGPTSASASSAPSAQASSFAATSPTPQNAPGFPGDGTFAVGTDIKPGTYRTAGAASSLVPNCYWERDRDLTGTMGSIIANGNTTGPAIVQILSTDAAFKTSGCQPWTLVATAAAPPGNAPSAAPAQPTTQSGTDPASVVEAYYAAVNARDYATAWRLGGSHFASSYDTFVANYSNTSHDDLLVTSVSGNRVYIDLTAYNRDGTVQHFSGYYVVNGGVLTGADIH